VANEGPSVTQLRALMEAREADDAAQAAAKRTASRKRTLELEVHEAMVWAGWKGEHKIDLGPPWGVQGFTPKATETGKVYNEDELLEWAQERGLLSTFFGEPTVRKQQINQWIKRAKRGQAELPPGVEPIDRPFVSVRDIK
jgi:hypothetical protein